MSRVVRITILAVVALSTAVLTGCSSNPSGVHLQDPPPQATSTSSAAPVASASLAPQSSPAVTSTGRSTPTSPASSPAAISPVPSATRRSAAASSTATATPTSTVTPADPEAADRVAIEAVWTKYWNDVLTLGRIPAPQRQAVMEVVAVPALAATVVAATATEAAAGRQDFGTVTHRPFWATPVGGKPTAVMSDCLNASKSGTLEVKTGKTLSTGGPRNNLRISFVASVSGGWQVSKVEVIANVQC